MKKSTIHKLTKIGVALMLIFSSEWNIYGKDYPVVSFGAVGDGETENAESIQKAIDAASEAGGGVIKFPAGVFVTKTIFIKDNVSLYLEKGAVIKGSPDYDAYPSDIEPLYETFLLRKDRYPSRVLIVGLRVNNVAIEGEGTIDGNGDHPNLRLKRMESINLIRFIACKNVRVEGTGEKLKIVNASHWALQPINVDGLVVRNVHIVNYGGNTPDGLPICDSKNVLVEDCLVEADDDAISVKSGTPEILMENITIKNTTMISRVCGFKFGPQTFGGFKNIKITGCHFEGATLPPATQYDPHHGVFLNVSNGGYIDGVLVENCTANNIPSTLSIYLGNVKDQYWRTWWPGKHEAEDFGSIQNVTFRNIKATNMGQFGIMIEGRAESKIENVLFDHVQIASQGGGEVIPVPSEKPYNYPNLIYLFDGNISTWGMFLRHVDGVKFKDVHLWTKAEDRRPDLFTDDVHNFNPGSYKAQVQPKIWTPDSTSTFEVGTQIRAWTIRDEGMSTILDNMQQMAGINNVYMVVVMHEEQRPFAAPEFPHNPARDRWQAEDSRVTFFPDTTRYGKVKPLLSDTSWIRETDWLQLLVDSCRARGLAVGAEVSHYPIPKSIIKAHPDWQQKKINGESGSTARFCPNSPEPREYVINLFGDLAENYDLDYIQTCQHLFWHNDIDDGGTCFCEHCMREAKKAGFDLKAAKAVLAKDKNAQPEREQWMAFRAASTTRFYKDISDEIARVKRNTKCHLRYNDTYPYRKGEWDPRDLSMYIDDVSRYLGSLVNQDHQEQEGDSLETFDRRKRWLATNRKMIGPDMPLICGIAPRMKATPNLVKAGIKVAIDHPANVNGLALKHYDGASFGLLRAFKQGMIDAGVQGLTPTMGKEFENMELENFTYVDDFVEEWGIETSGKGIAKYTFLNPTNTYNIRISYFDEDKGHSNVSLFVAGKKRASFLLDENSDCWRWRTVENIEVKKGDEIKIVAKSKKGEKVRLDYIEFIAKDNE